MKVLDKVDCAVIDTYLLYHARMQSNEFSVEAYANPWRVDKHSIAGLLAFIMRCAA